MAGPEPNGTVWRTSSYTAGNGACVEIALILDGVLVRDSKDRQGPTLSFSTPGWRAFLVSVTERESLPDTLAVSASSAPVSG